MTEWSSLRLWHKARRCIRTQRVNLRGIDYSYRNGWEDISVLFDRFCFVQRDSVKGSTFCDEICGKLFHNSFHLSIHLSESPNGDGININRIIQFDPSAWFHLFLTLQKSHFPALFNGHDTLRITELHFVNRKLNLSNANQGVSFSFIWTKTQDVKTSIRGASLKVTDTDRYIFCKVYKNSPDDGVMSEK